MSEDITRLQPTGTSKNLLDHFSIAACGTAQYVALGKLVGCAGGVSVMLITPVCYPLQSTMIYLVVMETQHPDVAPNLAAAEGRYKIRTQANTVMLHVNTSLRSKS